jgi:predicted nucleotidyltransferase
MRFTRDNVCESAVLIGSLATGKESDNDIDILLPCKKLTNRLKRKLIKLYGAETHSTTDWGGLFLHNTYFGNIDIFFTTKNFDYPFKK